MSRLPSSLLQRHRWILSARFAARFSTSARLAAVSAVKENPHHRNRVKFDRDKLCVNVGTLGAPHHGKTTITSAITRVLAASHAVPFLDIGDIDHTAFEKECGHSQNTKHLEWWTDNWFVSHSDMPGLKNYVKNAMGPLPSLDAVILCVRADRGVTRETLVHYHVAKHFGVPTVVPFINVSGEPDEELLDLVKMELEESLTVDDMNRLAVGDALSSQTAKDDDAVTSVLDSLKKDLRFRSRNPDAPFLMHVEASGEIPNKGLFTGGRVTQGKAVPGENLEAFVSGITSKVVYKDVEIFKKITPELLVGDRGGGFLKKANKVVELKRGSLIYHPDAVKDGWKASRHWKIRVRAVPGQKEESLNDRAFLFHRGNNESVAFKTSAVVDDQTEVVMEVTSRQEILAKLGDPIVLRNGDLTFLGNLVD